MSTNMSWTLMETGELETRTATRISGKHIFREKADVNVVFGSV